MPIVVRRASEADVDTLIRLNRGVQALHANLYPGDFKAVTEHLEARAFFSRQLQNTDSVMAIARLGSTQAGYVWFDLQSRPETPFTFARRRVYLHHISVSPEARRRGVGSALMNYLEQRAVQEATQEIAVATWSANVVAQRFFASRGFDSFTISLRKTLGADR